MNPRRERASVPPELPRPTPLDRARLRRRNLWLASAVFFASAFAVLLLCAHLATLDRNGVAGAVGGLGGLLVICGGICGAAGIDQHVVVHAIEDAADKAGAP